MPTQIENFNFIDGVNITKDSLEQYGLLNPTISSISSFIDSNFSNLDHGPAAGLYDLVIRPSSFVTAIVRSYIAEYEKNRSLSSALDGALTSNEIVDSILSNFFISRKSGNKTHGFIRITVEDSNSIYRIPTQATFTTSEGLVFINQQERYATSSPTSPDHTKIFSSAGSSYGYFIIEVEAQENGSEYNIPKNIQLAYSANDSGMISCIADQNFNGGLDDEDNKDMANRVSSSLSARGLFSQASIESYISNSVPWARYVQIQGISSLYMHRNIVPPFGTKTGCACDVYVSPENAPSITYYRAIASRVESNTFKLTISPDVFPGHIDIDEVAPKTHDVFVGSYTITKKERYIPQTTQIQRHKFTRPEDAIYTRYSATDVYFTVDDISVDDELLVEAAIYGQPGIEYVQDILDSEDVGVAMVDAVARIATPCLVSAQRIAVKMKHGYTIDVAKILSTFSLYVSSCTKDSYIRIDKLISKITEIEGIDGIDIPLLLEGKMYPPTAEPEIIRISSMTKLEIPSLPHKLVGPGLIQFISDINNIKIVEIK